ncbi:hypothetical protein PFISCL1PPCAC_22036 [Pristionchus fissidentatus]|uniref:Uncharacterized protein n=1 Tax=Pristionchus fissidentatus TaxID=1538716 RepID=A0AAV5WFC3_9BILA|nr:hypothetical protein PFISCL1PPCAC_22036 [Pristionchus fissidentatus]
MITMEAINDSRGVDAASSRSLYDRQESEERNRIHHMLWSRDTVDSTFEGGPSDGRATSSPIVSVLPIVNRIS